MKKDTFAEFILTTRIFPNPWNPNKTSTRVDAAILESIRKYGFIDPITVRHHPTEPFCYEVIDGEHRLEAAQTLALHKIPAIVLNLNDDDAKRLTIIANETRGRADDIALGLLLEELQDESGKSDLMGLPYYDQEVEELIQKAHAENKEPLEVEALPRRVTIKHPTQGFNEFITDLQACLQNHPGATLTI